jgi:two-component system sensor histidine kinase KdpD
MYYLKALLRCIGIVVVMIAITELLGGHRGVVPGTMALAYLTVVIIVAALWQVRQGLFACATAALCFAYFLPPDHSFRITQMRHWILLAAFLVTAITASYLSNRIQTEAAVANLRREEMERLYDLGQRLLTEGNVADLLRSIPRSLTLSFQLNSALIYIAEQDRVYSSDSLDGEAPAPTLQELESMRASMKQPAGTTKSKDRIEIPLRTGLSPIGLLILTGNMPAIETLETIGSLVTMSIRRATAMEETARSEAGRVNEWMRHVLLDSATRELRLPMLEIESAAALLHDPEISSAQRESALASIMAQTARLHGLIDQAATMVQLEPSELKMQPQPGSLREVVETALAARASTLRQHTVELDLLERSHSVLMDAGWIVQVLGYLLDNAALYSNPKEKIVIHSESRGNKLLVSVIDGGVGIDPAEHTLIFERFYRCANQPEGSKSAGMGLSIARSIVEAHGGTLEVSSQPGHGAAFTFSLPLAAE